MVRLLIDPSTHSCFLEKCS